MAPGASSMLRSRRKDVNVKPNRRLDKKSSRGMLYENEELRMRTITINEEVERGQSDIKKLRRENEQLRREIWGLRDEYDRLEGIIEDLKDETDSEDESDYEEEDDEEPEVDAHDAENPENLENAQKEQKASTQAQAQSLEPGRGTSFKKEFDGLSVVDEETDDNPSSSMHEISPDPTTLPAASRIGWNYGNAAYQPPPAWQPSPRMEGRFFAPLPSQEPPPEDQYPGYGGVPLPYELGGGENAFCGTITLPSGRQGVYFSDATLPQWDEAAAWGGQDLLPCAHGEADPPAGQVPTKMGYAYTYYGNNVPPTVPQTTANSMADCELLTDCFDKRCGPDLLIPSLYPADKSTLQNGGDLDPFLGEANCNLARVEIVPELPTECGHEHTEQQTPASASSSSVGPPAPRRSSSQVQVEGGPEPGAPVAESPGGGQAARGVSETVASVYSRTAEARRFLGRQDGDAGLAILKRRQSIIATTISVRRQDEEVYGRRECEAYRRPPSYIRLNSIRPNTLVFAADHEDLTVQEVIDALDAQISTSLCDAVRGVRVVNGSCFICLARQTDVGQLLDSGFSLRGSPVRLEDVSKGSVILALSGVPHHVTDSAVAIIMSNFGTIIGEVERRLYKGVDTGERLLRLKPGAGVSQQLPPTITVAGAQVTIVVLPPREVDKLGFVGTRENPANEMTCHTYNHVGSRGAHSGGVATGGPSPTTEPYSNSSDRFKSQLLVHLKPPDSSGEDNSASANHGPKVGNGLATKKYSTARCPQNVPPAHAPPVAVAPPCNPFTQVLTPPTQSNPFIPGFAPPAANEHVNPTFNTYTPRTSPTSDRKFSGTSKPVAEAHTNLPTSPQSARKVHATPNSSSVGNSATPVPSGAFPYLPNASYLHGSVANTSQGPPQSAEHNPSNLSLSSDKDNHLEVPSANSVPNSPLSLRKQRINRKLSTMTRQRSSDEILQGCAPSAPAPASRHQTAPNSPNVHRKNGRAAAPRKMSSHSTSSQNVDNSEAERSIPNATSSPLSRPKHHGNRKLSVSINEPSQSHNANVVDVSRSSSSGQDSPTKVERRRRVSIYFNNNKKPSRKNSSALTRSASLDPTRCRFGNPSLDGGLTEQTTTCSERERTNSCSSRGSSVGGGGKRKSRRSSFRTLEGADNGKVPWCGCWGNGCM